MLRLYERENPQEALRLNKIVRNNSARGCLGNRNVVEFYKLNKLSYLLEAPYDFESFLIYLEWDREPEKRFYLPRRKVMKTLVKSLQDFEDDVIDILTISLPPGVGKAQPLYSKLVTPSGYKNMGDIKVGDLVATQDGTFTNVIGVYPQGEKDIYRVRFNDGSYTDCCDNHLWKIQSEEDRESGKYRIVELKDILKTYKIEKYSIDTCKPVDFDKNLKNKIGLHPHTFGNLVAKGDFDRIPQEYLITTKENRLELLVGLLGNSGYNAYHNGATFEIKNENVAKDIIFLVNSLGGMAVVSGNRVYATFAYNIFSEESDITLKRYITKIESVGKDSCQCIMVEHPSHLYLTDNFIVTHNTTLGCFFLAWIMGRYPESCNLASAHGDKLTRGFYDQVSTILTDTEYNYKDVFPNVTIEAFNSKDETINLNKRKRFKTLTCRSIGGGLTGATRCDKYLYCDDLVSGIEEALNRERLDTLWSKYTNDLKSRKKKYCKEIHIATRWSVWDVIGRLQMQYGDNERVRFIDIPALNENDESNFDYDYGVGFDTAYFLDMRNSLDDVSWKCLFQNQPIEREGMLFPEDDLLYYNGTLPSPTPDRIVAFCDVAWGGGDYLSMPIGYIYGEDVYIHDVVFNNKNKEITRPNVVGKILQHKPHHVRFEANNGGDEYADFVDKELREKHSFRINISHRKAPSNQSKVSRIIQASPDIQRFYFIDKKNRNKEYWSFMNNLTNFMTTAKNKHDDAPDSLAGLTTLISPKYGQVSTMERPF